jgi:hypothetical protein
VRGARCIDHVLVNEAYRGLVGKTIRLTQFPAGSDHYAILGALRVPGVPRRARASDCPPAFKLLRPCQVGATQQCATIAADDTWEACLNKFAALDDDNNLGDDERLEEHATATRTAVGAFREGKVGGVEAEVRRVRCNGKRCNGAFPVSIRRLYEKRDRAYKDYCKSGDSPHRRSSFLQGRYAALRATAAAEARSYLKKVRNEDIINETKDMKADPAPGWRYIERQNTSPAARGKAAKTLPPVKDEAGHLQTSAEGIKRAHFDHWSPLLAEPAPAAAAAPGPAAAAAPPHVFVPVGPRASLLSGLTERPLWQELYSQIDRLSRNKAPGDDGVCAELLKAALFIQVENGDYLKADISPVPPTRMAMVLHRLVLRCWTDRKVPPSWGRMKIVPIPKKGDKLDLNNFRGISILPAIAKLFNALLASRLTASLEKHRRLVPEQAGFRPDEEGMAQVVSLMEILQRRKENGDRTLLLFIDLAKAYDTVPQQALFDKIEHMGVPREFIDMIASVYNHSVARVRLANGEVTAEIGVGRGVRQGCPLSPILFDMYINDFFGSIECDPNTGFARDASFRKLGVEVPLIDRREGISIGNASSNGDAAVRRGRCAGLQFADDTVGLAKDLLGLKRQLCRAETWCAANRMTMSATKCCVMAITPLKGRRRQHRHPRHIHRLLQRWSHANEIQLNGVNVQVLLPLPRGGKPAAGTLEPHYLYLGVPITHSLSLTPVHQHRLKVAKHVLADYRAVLGQQHTSMHVRVQIVRAKLVPTMLYGTELTGMGPAGGAWIKGLETLINQVLRIMVGLKGGGVSMQAIRAELGIPSIRAASDARRTRGWCKWRRLCTWISPLHESGAKHGATKCWVERSMRWLCHNENSCNYDAGIMDWRVLWDTATGQEPALLAGGLSSVQHPKTIARRMQRAVDANAARRDTTAGYKYYEECAFGSNGTRSGLLDTGVAPGFARGLAEIARARLSGLYCAASIGRNKSNDQEWIDLCTNNDWDTAAMCPLCGGNEPDDSRGMHCLLSCRASSELTAARRLLIDPLVASMEAVMASDDSFPHNTMSFEELTSCLLGGKPAAWVHGMHPETLPHWALRASTTLGPPDAMAQQLSQPHITLFAGNVCLQVAAFLCVADRVRAPKLAALSRCRLPT